MKYVLFILLSISTSSWIQCQSTIASNANHNCCDRSQIDQKFHFELSIDRGRPEYEANKVLYERILTYMNRCELTRIEVSFHGSDKNTNSMALNIAQGIANILVFNCISPSRLILDNWTKRTETVAMESLYPSANAHVSQEQWAEFRIISCE